MRFVTFRDTSGYVQAGIVKDDRVIGLGAAGFSDVRSLLSHGDAGINRAQQYAASAPAGAELSTVALLAPITRPPKVICVGLNYRDHAIESKMEIPQVPTIFSKFSNSVIGASEPIVLPKNSVKPDYEAEFAVVIGKIGRHITEEQALDHVFGYTCVNDVSARDYQMATTQWLMGKTFDTFCPMGPWIVTKDEIADPHALDIRMTINGEVLQNSNTRELIFKVPQLIAYVSSVCTLEPGDVISTGTPSGVGFSHKPPRWLRPGDDCVVYVQGIGELRNRVIAEAESASSSAAKQ
jgi:2-keto-4-pentenoate hydratase/2-oxohepta-3-ene-1,7-dioic acid hydratase in catechol pathway